MKRAAKSTEMVPAVARTVEVPRSSGNQAAVVGGAIDAASSTSAEMHNWQLSLKSPDRAINTAKPTLDIRSQDMLQNDGVSQSSLNINRDSIVGSQYRLNSQPEWRIVKTVCRAADETWAEEFQEAVETCFNLMADSEYCWFDYSGKTTFTGLIRLGLASWAGSGEILRASEWDRTPGRPFRTSFSQASPHRLRNPNNGPDTETLRRGVEINERSAKPVAYHISRTHPGDLHFMAKQDQWQRIEARKPWGRKMVSHIFEADQAEQNRGISAMVSVLSDMRMLKQFKRTTLQNAVLNASYAATMESELPPEMIRLMMGGTSGGTPAEGIQQGLGAYLGMLADYMAGSKRIDVNGSMIPHLFPGSKLNTKTLGTPGGIGTEFETGILRHIAAGLGVSYEELARDYSKVSYSAARASVVNSERTMRGRKKMIADRDANFMFDNWLEEQMAMGALPMPRGWQPWMFYQPMVREALTACSWIGSGRGQIDEMKESQSAIMRINAGLSTHEIELAKFGMDYRVVFKQRAREVKLMKSLGLDFSSDATRTNAGSQSIQEGGSNGTGDDEQDREDEQ